MPDSSRTLVPPLSARDHQRGPAEAPLTLVEFGDYACAFCREAHPVVEELRAALEGHVCFAYRHFPVASPRRSRPAARAAEVAAAQGAFWEMYAALSTEAGARLSEERLFAMAERLDLDTDRFRSAFENDTGADRVAADYESAQQSGVTGTPAFFLNGRRFDAAHDVDHALSQTELDEAARATAVDHFQRLQASL